MTTLDYNMTTTSACPTCKGQMTHSESSYLGQKIVHDECHECGYTFDLTEPRTDEPVSMSP